MQPPFAVLTLKNMIKNFYTPQEMLYINSMSVAYLNNGVFFVVLQIADEALGFARADTALRVVVLPLTVLASLL